MVQSIFTVMHTLIFFIGEYDSGGETGMSAVDYLTMHWHQIPTLVADFNSIPAP